jgi:uroporphyrinogen III methyltransferase/synthase
MPKEHNTHPAPAPGRVHLVGAGPGDPELITLRGMRVLSAADAVVHDFMVHPDLLAQARKDAQIFCVGKHAGRHTIEQDSINVFGRGGEEALALAAAGIPFDVVPGVTSAVAVPANAGIPVTHRGMARAFHVITGHNPPEGQAAPPLPGPDEGTLVFLMGLRRLEAITAQLLNRGWPANTPAAVVSQGTLPEQQTVVGIVSDIAAKAVAQNLPSPAILLVGEVVSLRAQLARHDGSSPFFTSSPEKREGT